VTSPPGPGKFHARRAEQPSDRRRWHKRRTISRAGCWRLEDVLAALRKAIRPSTFGASAGASIASIVAQGFTATRLFEVLHDTGGRALPVPPGKRATSRWVDWRGRRRASPWKRCGLGVPGRLRQASATAPPSCDLALSPRLVLHRSVPALRGNYSPGEPIQRLAPSRAS